MPVMDGITATIEIKKQMYMYGTLPQDIQIIALTAYLDEKTNCLNAGMSDFMTKPTSQAVLQDMLVKY